MAFNWSDARLLDQVAYDLILGDAPRSLNRAMINSLANGSPPYSKKEEEDNNIRINTNDLSHTRVLQEARAQFTNGFMNQANYFTCKTDAGPVHKNDIWSQVVTREANRLLKDDIEYYEAMRSSFASLTLHGISPLVWENKSTPIPMPIGVEDALIPSGTLLSFKNLPFMFIRRSFTGIELAKITQRIKRDPGWNMPFVRRCQEWLDRQMTDLVSQNWPETWSFEKWEESAKEDAGWYAGDRCPTLDTFDIYAYKEATKRQPAGWVRRIILDSWSNPGTTPGGAVITRRDDRTDKDGKSIDNPGNDDFLFTSGERVVADSWQNVAAFQYADLSAVAPFRYHSVRSLGWMTYALCHLKNRMMCKFNESVFEALLQYFKVKSQDDVQRALKLELASMGVIDETITPVPAAERWQPNVGLIELGIQTNQQAIDANSKAWTQNPNSTNQKTEKTKFQVMAEIQQANALVMAGLQQAYAYKTFEYREIFRRLLRSNSPDMKVKQFRARCMSKGVPYNMLNDTTKWDVQSERMQGGGNQTLELLIADELLKLRQFLDPEPQRIVTRNVIATLTKNPTMALELVPESPAKVTSATNEATLAAGSLLQGIEVPPLTGINHPEYIEAMLKILAQRVQKGVKAGGMVNDPKELQGMQMIANNIAQHIKILESDPEEKQKVKQYNDILAKLVNMIKAFEQRLQEAMKKQSQQKQQQNGHDPAAAAKAQATMMQAQVKAKTSAASHQQKMQQRDQQFKQKLALEQARTQADIAKLDLTTAADINRGGLAAADEGEQE